MTDLNAFRQETREWLEANCPDSMREPVRSFEDYYMGGRNPEIAHPEQKLWCDRMAERGWTVPHWPKEYGGGGLAGDELRILREEMARISARRPLDSFGISMLGPALLEFGSEEQKREHLPPICRGEIRWCQGYSEPNAGSDLASLQTRAEDKGDHFLVNGQKIWTSYADKADWIFCLVRTDPNATKHNGISFALFDMESEGVSTRPIELISGESPFCETFFDDVKVGKDQIVGELNRGWDVAKYLLTHERNNIGGEPPGFLKGRALGPLAAEHVGTEHGKLADSALRADIARLEIDQMAFQALVGKIREEAEAGQGVGAQSAVLKYYGTELNKRRYEVMMDALGAEGLEWESERTMGGLYAREWLRSKGNSIEGGTSEVMLGIVSKRLLGLPDA